MGILIALLWLGFIAYLATTKQNVVQMHLLLAWLFILGTVLYALGRLLFS